MGITPTDSLHLLLEESGSTSRVGNPSDSISECLVDLPQELITEILVRLPVKSLLRFKCVSTQWLSLISDPQFIRSHSSKSSSMDAADDLNVELLYTTKTGMKRCCLYSALHQADPSIHFFGIQLGSPRRKTVVGIINGLVCLKLKGTDFCVWNPALNKTKHFNICPKAPSRPRLIMDYDFSFGYDETNDDYKLVSFQTVKEGNAEVSVYSLRADSWRRIDQLEGFYPVDTGAFANGKIYWFGTPNGKIVSLDMVSDKFVEMQQPEYDAGDCELEMGESGGRPFVLCDYYEGMKVDLWVLDKCGVEDSWCKLLSFPYEMFGGGFSYRFLCISRSGEIVFGNVDGLLVCDWKKKEYREIELVVDITSTWRVAAYVESLVWPNYD